MNFSERSTGYKNYTIVADHPQAELGVGIDEMKTAGWFVRYVHVAPTEYGKSMMPSEWENEIAHSERWKHLEVVPHRLMATEKEAVEEAIRFAKEAIACGFNQPA